MEKLAASLLEELNCETAFTIPVFGGIKVAESTVITWGIMAVLVLLALWLTRDMKIHNISRRQAAVESAVTWLDHFVEDMIGSEGKQYVPYLVTVLLYVALSNVSGLFGVKPPTKDLNVTAALYSADRGSGDPEAGHEEMGKELCRTGPHHRTHQCAGNLYPAFVSLHASVWKRAGSIRDHGTDQTAGAGGTAPAFQLLFRYL